MNETVDVIKTKDELYSDCDEANKSLELSYASPSQIALFKACNFLITAHRIEKGDGFVSSVAEVVVPFLFYHYKGKCGDVLVGNIKPGVDSTSAHITTLSQKR